MTLNDRERAAVRSAIETLSRVPAQAPYSWATAQARDALRPIIDSAEPGRPADATGDSFETLLADMDAKSAAGSAVRGWAARLRDLVAAEMLNEEQNTPEVVSRDKVNDLPRGSRVVGATVQGQAVAGGIVREVGVGVKLDLYHHYLVLHRSPEKPIAVGDVLAIDSDFNRAKPGTIIRHTDDSGAYRKLTDGTWATFGREKSIPTIYTDMIVVYVPEGEVRY